MRLYALQDVVSTAPSAQRVGSGSGHPWGGGQGRNYQVLELRWFLDQLRVCHSVLHSRSRRHSPTAACWRGTKPGTASTMLHGMLRAGLAMTGTLCACK